MRVPQSLAWDGGVLCPGSGGGSESHDELPCLVLRAVEGWEMDSSFMPWKPCVLLCGRQMEKILGMV